MIALKNALWVFCFCAMPLTAVALDTVEILSSTASLREESFGSSSPTPAWCWWENDPLVPGEIQATQSDGYGNYGCLEQWFVHCDSDSLVFRGSWSAVESNNFSSSHYAVELTSTVRLTAITVLYACRQVEGDLEDDEHILTIAAVGGDMTPLLAAGSALDEVTRAFLPGEYEVKLRVNAREVRSADAGRDAYTGQVRLVWGDQGPVAESALSWGTLKALYR